MTSSVCERVEHGLNERELTVLALSASKRQRASPVLHDAGK
jgi:hypothetical protein